MEPGIEFTLAGKTYLWQGAFPDSPAWDRRIEKAHRALLEMVWSTDPPSFIERPKGDQAATTVALLELMGAENIRVHSPRGDGVLYDTDLPDYALD